MAPQAQAEGVGPDFVMLAAVEAAALTFDFTKGFHDTANAIAAPISTEALGLRTAVALPAVLNFLGAFLSLSVAAMIASGIVDADAVTLAIVLAGLVGGIIWNLTPGCSGCPPTLRKADRWGSWGNGGDDEAPASARLWTVI